jgi:Sigma-70, region 4
LACLEALLGEASVHRPHRGNVWVAAFQDENGRHVWKSTGQRDRNAAQAIADEWEAEAREKRAAQGVQGKMPTIRVRTGSGEGALGLLTQKEVAAIMKISERAVRAIEHRAIAKLRNHPVLKEVLREWQGHDIEESRVPTEYQLSREEVAAVLALARTPFERYAVRKLLRVASGPLPADQKSASTPAPGL